MKIISALVVFGSILAAAGCGSGNYGGDVQMTPEESKASLEKQIKDIENNDKMPPQAKQAAIGALRNAEAMGKGQTSSK
jgi:hypothetical protein